MDEVGLICINAANNGYVDVLPSAVSTGFQNQNVAAQGTWNGFDNTSCAISGTDLIIYQSGIIDVSGLPFVVKSQITLTLPVTGTNHYLKVVAGSTGILKEIEFTTDRGTYDNAKNGFYNAGGERVLNWLYSLQDVSLNRISGIQIIDPIFKTKKIEIGDWNMDIDNVKSVVHGLADYKKIRNISVVVRDNNGVPYFLNIVTTSLVLQGGIASHNGTHIHLTRLTGGTFDSVLFNATSYNRGWITIEYVLE